MRVQDWIFSVRYSTPGSPIERLGLRDRWAVVGPARSSTVEVALHLASVPETIRGEIRTCEIVRDFVEGRLDPERSGYYTSGGGPSSWAVCIGSVHDVLSNEDRRILTR